MFFDFLALPRELRNLVYASVFSERTEGDGTLKVRIPHADARLVNRQFSFEYGEETTHEHFRLTIYDAGRNLYFCPKSASRSKHLEFVLMLGHCPDWTTCHESGTCLARASLVADMQWVAAFIARFGTMRTISFRLALSPGALSCLEGVVSYFGSVRVIAKGGGIEVVMPKVRSNECKLPLVMWEYAGERFDVQLVAEWTADDTEVKVYADCAQA